MQTETVHQFLRDKLGREVHDCVVTLGAGVDGTVRRISTPFNVLGAVHSISSHDDPTPGSGTVLNEVKRKYDDLGMLVNELQEHDGPVNGNTPSVGYNYQKTVSGGEIIVGPRLESLRYPNGRRWRSATLHFAGGSTMYLSGDQFLCLRGWTTWIAFFVFASAVTAQEPTNAETEPLILEFGYEGIRQQVRVAEESDFWVVADVERGRVRASGHVGAEQDGQLKVTAEISIELRDGGGSGNRIDRQLRLGQFAAGLSNMPPSAPLQFLWVRRGLDPVPTLIAALRRRDVGSKSAAYYLGRLGADGQAAVPHLLEALEPQTDDQTRLDDGQLAWLRENAIAALGRIGPDAEGAVPTLLDELRGASCGRLQVAAGLALWKIARHPDGMAALTEAFSDADRIVRLKALEAILEIGLEAPQAAPALISLLDDPVPEIRADAAAALWMMVRDPMALDVLMEMLNREGAGYGQAARALERIGYPDAHRATEALAVHVLTGREPSRSVMEALVRIDPDASVTVSVLLGKLREANTAKNLGASSAALARFGPTIVPRMRELLNAEDEASRDLAFFTLWRIGPGAVPTLSEALRHPDPNVRKRAARWLADMDVPAELAIPDLVRILTDDVETVRVEASYTLFRIGPPAIPAVEQLLNSPELAIRQRAERILQDIEWDKRDE